MATHPLVSPILRLPTASDLLDRIRDETHSASRFLPTTFILLLLAIGYYLGTLLGIVLKPDQTSMATFWPPSAILLGAFLAAPRRRWWLLLLAVLPAHLLAQVQAGGTPLNALGWFVGTASGALLAAAAIRFCKQGRLFDNVQGVLAFLGFGILAGPLLKSFLDVAVGVERPVGSSYWMSWTTRLSANMIAGLILVPIIVLFARSGVSWIAKVTAARWLEAGLLALCVISVSLFVFGTNAVPNSIPALILIPLLFLLWAALRFGPGGLSASLLAVALISIWGTIQGRGPLVGGAIGENVLRLHIVLGTAAVLLMLLAAAVAERRHAEDSLRNTRVKLIDAQEQERHRIARELHDDIVQQLTLLGLNMEKVRTHSDYPMKSDLDQLYQQVSTVSEATRELSHDLHPFVLEYLGLAKALKLLCQHVGTQSGINISFELEGAPPRMPADVSLSLYRVAQEALQNVVKHSQARAAGIELKAHSGRALLRITDNGVGMSPEQHPFGGMGIVSMRERVMALDGKFRINSAPGKGTTIEVSLRVGGSSRRRELGAAAVS